MTSRRNIYRPLIPLLGTTCLISPFYFKLERFPSSSVPINDAPPRRLDIAVDGDDLVSASLTVISKGSSDTRIGSSDHQKIVDILDDARGLMTRAQSLIQQESKEAKDVVDAATLKFREAREYIMKQSKTEDVDGDAAEPKKEEEERELVATVDGDGDDLDLDLSREVYETYITFPECIEKKFEDCLTIVNNDLANLGLGTVELVVHEKRNINQDGYNKVVIVTNADADVVQGRQGDGIVSYPFTWDDAKLGTRTLGVDGKWNCQGITPQDCCTLVKESAINPDTKGNYLECHIFVPFGGVGNAKRDDRVFINLSPDGRVHEAPVIQ